MQLISQIVWVLDERGSIFFVFSLMFFSQFSLYMTCIFFCAFCVFINTTSYVSKKRKKTSFGCSIVCTNKKKGSFGISNLSFLYQALIGKFSLIYVGKFTLWWGSMGKKEWVGTLMNLHVIMGLGWSLESYQEDLRFFLL